MQEEVSMNKKVLIGLFAMLAITSFLAGVAYTLLQANRPPGQSESKRSQAMDQLMNRTDIDPRAVQEARWLGFYADCIINRQDCGDDESSTWDLFLAQLDDVTAYGLTPEDLGFAPEELAELALLQAQRTLPSYQVFVEWKEFMPPIKQAEDDGGIRFWVLHNAGDQLRMLWFEHDLVLHLPRARAEALIQKVFGQQERPSDQKLVLDNGPMGQDLHWAYFTGCKNGQEFDIVGFSRPLPKNESLWQSIRQMPEVKSVDVHERTVVILTNNREPLAPRRDRSQGESPSSLIIRDSDWGGNGGSMSDDFDQREFSRVVSGLKLAPCEYQPEKKG
jgi:hypothetical protein